MGRWYDSEEAGPPTTRGVYTEEGRRQRRIEALQRPRIRGRFVPTAPEARHAARKVAAESMTEIFVRLRAERLRTENGHPQLLSMRELVEIWKVSADLGGFLGGRELAAAENMRWKMAAELLAAPGLSEAERAQIISEVRAREAAALGEEQAEPSGFDVGGDESGADLGTDE